MKAVADWKGPWKCSACGVVLDSNETPHMWKSGPYGYCKGEMKPHDRRAPDPRVAALVEAARLAVVALRDLGACDDPECTEENCNHALPMLEAALAALEGEGR